MNTKTPGDSLSLAPSSATPRHVAIIMDGNGRWATARGKPRTDGHRCGADAVREIVRGCCAAGVEYLSLYAFSLANWNRPVTEVDCLMGMIAVFAQNEVDELCEQGISVGLIGRPQDLSEPTRRALDTLVARTSKGTRMRLSIALSYSGRMDVVSATRKAVELALSAKLRPEEVDDLWLRAHMSTRDLPDPDLVIRTGGEQRLSDFLPFESVYSELYFTSQYWPDFTERDLRAALESYGRRERRFGQTGEQIRAQPKETRHSPHIE